MPIYEYKGKSYDISTQDPAEAKRKILGYLDVNEPGTLREFGRSAASLADVALNAATGTIDYLAYPLARAYYGQSMPPEQAAQRARTETTSPKDMIGTALGITGTPQYQGEAARQGTQFVGEQIQPVIKGAAQYTGLPEADIESMLGSAAMAAAPGVARAAGPIAQKTAQAAGTAASVATAPIRAGAQFTEGVFGGVTGRIAKPGQTPGPLQSPSSRIPLGETFIDPADWAKFQRGEITVDQLQSRPIQEFAKGPVDRAAVALSGETVPAAGQGMRAFGEALGRQYKRSPITSAIDIGVSALGLPPPVISYRAAQGLADAYLARRGFDPNLPKELQAAQGQAGVDIMRQRAMNQPPALTYNPSPAPGPVAPGPMYVSPEGVASPDIQAASVAGAQQKYAPQVVPGDAKAAVQAKAADIVSQTPIRTPEQQAIIDQIRERAAREREAKLAERAQLMAGSGYRPPADLAPAPAPAPAPTPAPAPVSGPVAPTTIADSLTQRRSALTPQTADEAAAVAAYQNMTPAEKARDTRQKNKVAKDQPPMEQFGTEKKPLGVRAAQAAVAEALEKGIDAEIVYKQGGNILKEKIYSTKKPPLKGDNNLVLDRSISQETQAEYFLTDRRSNKPYKLMHRFPTDGNAGEMKMYDISNATNPIEVPVPTGNQ
jgi:hypothetical protein